jgi:hypothetical protein
MLQLNPTVPLSTPKGTGYAIVLIDYSQEHDLIWVVVLDETGEIWAFPNRDVRGAKNYSMNREPK